jgi:hypothetical protein
MMFRLCVIVLRTFAWIVPRRDREDWLREWEAELGSRSRPLRLRPVIGSFYDAAWLRRQFTLDAEIVHDARHGARLLRPSPSCWPPRESTGS